MPQEENESVKEGEREEFVEDEVNQRKVKIIEPVDDLPLKPTGFEASTLKWWGELYLVKCLAVVSFFRLEIRQQNLSISSSFRSLLHKAALPATKIF